MIRNTLRWLLTILVTIVVFYTIDICFEWLVYRVIGFSTFWLIVLVIFFSSLIIGIFTAVTSVLISALMLISPNKKSSGLILGIGALIFLIADFIGYLKLDTTLFAKILVLIEVFVVWGSLCVLGFKTASEENG